MKRLLPSLLVLLPLVACKTKPDTGGITSPLGPLGDIDFTARLPDTVKIPPDATPKASEGTQTICKQPGHPGADVKVKWDTVTVGRDSYIGKSSFELTRVEDGLEVKMSDQRPMIGGSNLTPGQPYQAFAQVWFKCKARLGKGSYEGTGVVVFDTQGKIVPPPSE